MTISVPQNPQIHLLFMFNINTPAGKDVPHATHRGAPQVNLYDPPVSDSTGCRLHLIMATVALTPLAWAG